MQKINKKIIIVGAGIAGISSAIKLAKNKFNVEVFEAKKNIGGRAYSFQNRKTGEIIDNGQHLMMEAYNGFLSLLNELGTEYLLKKIKPFRIDFLDITGNSASLRTSLFSGKVSMALAILRLKSLSSTSRVRALMFATKILIGLYDAKDKTVYDFLKEHSQTEQIIKRLWEPIVLASLNCKTSEASAVLFVNVLKKAFFGNKESSTLIIPSEGLSALIAPFGQYLKDRECNINYSTGITKINFENNLISSVETKSGEKISADAYIFALPHNALLNLLTGHEIASDLCEDLSEYKFSTIISIYLWYDKDFMKQNLISSIGTKIQWVFNLRKLKNSDDEVKKNYPGHITVTISAANEFDNYTNDEVLSICLEEINLLFPEASNAKLLHSLVLCNKRATFMATANQEKKRLHNDTPIKNMFLAGDWTDTGLPATIEGSVQSGLLAAYKTQNYLLKL